MHLVFPQSNICQRNKYCHLYFKFLISFLLVFLSLSLKWNETPLGFKCFVFNSMFFLLYLPRALNYSPCCPCRSRSIEKGGDSTQRLLQNTENTKTKHTHSSMYLPTTTEKRRLNLTVSQNQPSSKFLNPLIMSRRIDCFATHRQAQELTSSDLPLTNRKLLILKDKCLIKNTDFNRNHRKKLAKMKSLVRD